jgi:hypothetical protein
MSLTIKSFALAGLLLVPGLASAQYGSFRVSPPGSGAAPAWQTQSVSRSMSSSAPPGFNYAPAPAPPAYPYPVPTGGYYPGVAGGYMQGQASVISSQGQFAVQQQQALMENEKVKSSRMDNHRKQLEEYLWERQNLPTLQDDRERTMQQELRRSRDNPPLTEIWSGKALNDLLTDIQKVEAGHGVRGPAIPLASDLLPHINLTNGTTRACTSMLRNDKLAWPMALRGEQFTAERDGIDRLVPQAARQASAGNIDPDTVSNLEDGVRKMRAHLKDLVADMSPNDYIQGARFLNQLGETLRVLNGPNASASFGGQMQARGRTVGELVDQMTRQGLKFSPVAEGDEAYYTALYQSLVGYDSSLSRLTTR